MEEQLPVFVYGTLRPGEHNHGWVARHTVDARPAVLPDHALYAAGLPWVVPQQGAQVSGDLLRLAPGVYAAALDRLDHLEGYRADGLWDDNLYVRTRVVVGLADGEASAAWVYLAGPREFARVVRPGALVRHGDWKKWRRLSDAA